MLVAEQQLLQQQDQLAVTAGAIPTNLVTAYRALGGGWQIREGKPFLPPQTVEAMAQRTNWGRLLAYEVEVPPVPVPRPAEFRAARSHEPVPLMPGPALARPLLRAVLLAGCKDEQRNAYVAPPPPPVTVAAPEVRTVTDYIELTGTTAAIATVQLVARVQGFLDQVHFQDGQRVKQGDLLFTHPAEHLSGAAAAGAVAARVASRRSSLHAQTEFDRYSGLFKQKAASAVDVDTWRANRDQAAGRRARRAGAARAGPDQSRLYDGHARRSTAAWAGI